MIKDRKGFAFYFCFFMMLTLFLINNSMRLGQAIDQFLAYMEVTKNPSRHTLKNYKCWLKRFNEWMGEDAMVEDITEKKINDYRFFLFNLKGQRGTRINIVSQGHHLVVIRVMLKFLLRMGEKTISPEVIELPKKPEMKVNFLTRDELERLFGVVIGTDIHAKRDRAVLHMLYSTGLRVSELSLLDRGDIDLETGELSVLSQMNVCTI